MSDNNDLRSWGDAYGNCAYFGSSLASIHSDDAMVKIQNALNGRSADVWIGLQADGKYPTFIFYYTTYFKNSLLLSNLKTNEFTSFIPSLKCSTWHMELGGSNTL